MHHDPHFLVSVLRVTDPTSDQLEDLKLNATRVEGLDRWLFEGDPIAWPQGPNVFDCGEIVVPCLGDLSDDELCSLVSSKLPRSIA